MYYDAGASDSPSMETCERGLSLELRVCSPLEGEGVEGMGTEPEASGVVKY